jgi:hypothetical protein
LRTAELFAVLEAPAAVAGFNDIAMVRKPVEQRSGHYRIAEGVRPFGEGQIGGHNDRGAPISLQARIDETRLRNCPGSEDKVKRDLEEMHALSLRRITGRDPLRPVDSGPADQAPLLAPVDDEPREPPSKYGAHDAAKPSPNPNFRRCGSVSH